MAEIKIQVQRSGIVPRMLLEEKTRGALFSVQEGQVPFTIRRVYAITDVPDTSISRGGHAHKRNDQALFVLQGSLTLHLDDGSETQSIRLTPQDPGIRLCPMLWHSMDQFSPDCVALVVASEQYDESDYIREYEAFKASVH